MALKIHVRKCAQCGDEFTVTGRAAGRAGICSPECKKLRQRQHERNHRESKYDPWKWENTILEWDE